jgi:dGTPase
VDVCDNLTYTAHDLDDGIRSGCVVPDDLRDAALWGAIWDETAEGLPLPLRVAAAVKGVIDVSVTDLLAATAERVAAAGIDSTDAVRGHAHLLVGYSEAFGRRQRELGRLLHERFYRHPRLLRAAVRARRVITTVFEAYTSEPGMLDAPWRAWAAEVGVPRACCDWIASMTDREAMDEYRRLDVPLAGE